MLCAIHQSLCAVEGEVGSQELLVLQQGLQLFLFIESDHFFVFRVEVGQGGFFLTQSLTLKIA